MHEKCATTPALSRNRLAWPTLGSCGPDFPLRVDRRSDISLLQNTTQLNHHFGEYHLSTLFGGCLWTSESWTLQNNFDGVSIRSTSYMTLTPAIRRIKRNWDFLKRSVTDSRAPWRIDDFMYEVLYFVHKRHSVRKLSDQTLPSGWCMCFHHLAIPLDYPLHVSSET